MRFAALQMTSTSDVTSNLEQAESLIAEAAAVGAHCALLPENFAVFDTQALWTWGVRQRQEGFFSRWLGAQAAQHRLTVIGGTVPYATEDETRRRVRARCLVATAEGIIAHYDKLHLFDVDVADTQGRYRESDAIEPGEHYGVHPIDSMRIGLTVCYDLRFPALFQCLRASGAEVITVPAAFTRITGEAHWMTLLRARAIETQCYVVAANQTGRHSPTRETFGHSCIISPWGDVLALRENGAGVVHADVDLELLSALRQRMPLQTHQRFYVKGPEECL